MDLAVLFKSNNVRLPQFLQQTIERMVHYLPVVLHPDGEIALFSDSAIGNAPPPRDVISQAANLFHVEPPRSDQAISRADSGYFRIGDVNDALIIDAGLCCPDELPAHAHCDVLSFELSLSGSRVIVDSGVYSYQELKWRNMFRSTSSHNTIKVDGLEQAEIWGSFRVGERPRKVKGRIDKEGEWDIFWGEHDAYRKVGVKHLRCIWCLQPVIAG